MRVMRDRKVETEGTSTCVPLQSSVSPLWAQEWDVRREEMEQRREHKAGVGQDEDC